MASGGMDWAYRMIAQHGLDPLGGMIVLHLGWRDAANFRTDRGIAKALNQHRGSVQRATAKLAALGLIERRSGQWVAAETVAIVEGSSAAPLPDPASSDGGGLVSRPAASVGRGGLVSRPQKASSVGHKRKENIEKARAPFVRRSRPLMVLPDPGNLTLFQRDRIMAGQSVLVAGVLVESGSQEADALRLALRSQVL